MAELPAVMQLQGAHASPTRGVTLYLNKDGGTLVGGWDDAANGVSSIAMNAFGGEATVPAWAGTTKAWNKVVACTRDRFSPFAVDVVTSRPRSGDFIMIMVGGTPDMFGYPSSVSGVAPYTGGVLGTAVGYVFSENINEDVDTTCVSVIHEAGHALGLDHAYLCEDPMSYLWGCGEKRFRDVDAYCGEGEERVCGDGATTQNSYRHLAAAVGLRDGSEPASDPPITTEEDDDPPLDDTGWSGGDGYDDDSHEADDGDAGWGSDDTGDQTYDDDGQGWDDSGWGDDAGDRDAPSVSIDGAAQDELAGNQWVEIVVRASDDGGVSDVELGWASDSAQYIISCGSPPDDMPVQCTRDGDVFRFQLYVGTGLRAMAARATDRAGNQAVSDARVLELTP